MRTGGNSPAEASCTDAANGLPGFVEGLNAGGGIAGHIEGLHEDLVFIDRLNVLIMDTAETGGGRSLVATGVAIGTDTAAGRGNSSSHFLVSIDLLVCLEGCRGVYTQIYVL